MDHWTLAGDPPLHLELLDLRHAEPLERFERANREYFARQVSDRGDAYFEHFEQRLASLVDENTTARSLCFVILDPAGEVVGRVNVYDIDQPGRTELGYRVAERVAGTGVATRGVTAALQVAATRGVESVIAGTSTTNRASQRVLDKCGFTATGPAESPAGSSTPSVGYRRTLTAGAG